MTTEWTERPEPPADPEDVPDRVLAVYGPTNPEKIQRHIYPLATVAETTLVCTTANEEVPEVEQKAAPDTGFRPLDLLAMFLLALVEGVRGDYEAVVSFSLLPNGCFALAVGRLVGAPVHLGIIGIDLDVHARSRYGPAVAALVRRFDAVTVPGPTHRRRLHEEIGVDPDRTAILANAIDPDAYRPGVDAETEYDLLWVGRFTGEKRPLLFVEAVAERHDADPSIEAVMVGDGPLAPEVRARIREHGIEDAVTLAGWVDDPLDYYRRSGTFVLTSERDALPLTLLEAMATGMPVVVPRVGNVPDLVRDGHNGAVVDDRTPVAFADGIRRVTDDPATAEAARSFAETVRSRFSYAAAAADWLAVLHILDGPGAPRDRPGGRESDAAEGRVAT